MKNYLLTLLLLFSLSTFAEQGDSMDDPIPITEAGTITFPEGKTQLYYSYTLTDSAVVILSEHADYYTSVYDSEGSSVDYGFSGEQKYHLAGETYVIYVESYISSSFDWSLTERDPIRGEFRYFPIKITESGKIGMGENTKRVYYSYTPETDGVACFENVNNITVEVYKKDNYDNLLEYHANNKLTIEASETYTFFLRSDKLETFEWDFIFANEKGATCSNPIIIDGFGTITSNIGTGTKYFKFTPNETDLIKIKTLNASISGDSKKNSEVTVGSLKLFGGCDYSDDSYLAWGENGKLAYEAQADQAFIIEYKLAAENYTNDVFSFTILPNSTLGGSCLSPVVITNTGEVTFPEGETEQYYSFTATKDGKISISDGETNELSVSMFLNCDGSSYDQEGNNGEMNINATAGTTYIIKWQSDYYTNASFTWTITEKDFTTGEACSNPIAVTQGSIDFDATEGILFYSYTAEKNGMVQISDANYSNNLKVLDGCNSFNDPLYGDNGSLEFECIKGKTYIIAWENTSYEIFQWAFSVRDADLGEACTNPMEISNIGDESAPTELALPKAAQYKNVFYSYTANANQVLVISDGDKSCNLALSEDCGFGLASYGSNGELEYEVKSGSTYIIRWKSNYFEDVPWTIYARDIIPGESMMSAIEIAAPGNVDYPAGLDQVYYKYTPSKDVAITGTTDENGPYTYTEDVFVIAGETKYITWFNNDKTAFTWTLTERDQVEGETCAKAIALSTPGNVVTNTSLSTIYYSFKATKNSILTITDNSDEHSVTHTKGCNDYSNYFSNTKGELAVEATTNDIQIIRWDLSDNNEFTWNFAENTPLVGETIENPKVISEPGKVNVIGVDKFLVRSYYSYTPSQDETVSISESDLVIVIDGSSKDTLTTKYYETTTFKASKNKNYLIVLGNQYSNASEFTLSAESEGTSNVSFNVSDGFKTLKNATITINKEILTTNTNGKANIALANGTYTYTISANPFVEQTGEVTVSGFDYIVTAVMAKPNEELYTVTFNFTDANGPVSNGFVFINNTTISADSETSVSIELVNGTYAYTASTLSHANTEGEVVVANTDQEVNVVLVPGETEKYMLRFIVDDGTNKVENASVTINESTLTTNVNGEASIELTDGGYAYEITATGFGKKTGTIYVDGKDLNEMVTLTPASAESYTLSFTISGNNAVLEGASIAINDSTLTSNTEGVASIELPNGTYSYTITAEGYQEYTQQTTIADANANIPVTLIADGEETFTITFTVKEGNTPIEGATISVNNTDIESNSEGVATITVVNGTYNYTVSAADYDNINDEVTVNGSNQDVAIALIKAVGINENTSVPLLYPNPAKSKITIKSNNAITELQVYSVTGVLLKQQKSTNTSININDLNNGVYLLKVKYQSSNEFIRFIKE